MKNKTKNINDFDFEIDYNLFTTEEIIKIINFYHNVMKYQKHQIAKETLIISYQEYRKTINSIALEKKYNQTFLEKTGISIYHLMKNIKNS